MVRKDCAKCNTVIEITYLGLPLRRLRAMLRRHSQRTRRALLGHLRLDHPHRPRVLRLESTRVDN